MTIHIEWVSVDFQREFTDPSGIWYVNGDSPSFVKQTLIPFMREHRIKLSEIVSDYRTPRNGKDGVGCIPGNKGFESEIPNDLIKGTSWVKCMHNPLWIRKNGGIAAMRPGVPYQDPIAFDNWLHHQIGDPTSDLWVVLIGETMEVCVASVAQELNARGYRVKILIEATDPMKERQKVKEWLMTQSSILLYADFISFEALRKEWER
jgi:nicotinamidase-related amidase